MLEAICNELAIELRGAFPGLIVRPQQLECSPTYHITIELNHASATRIVVWLHEEITITLWKRGLAIERMTYPYSDPEVFNYIQSFISERYNAYLTGKGEPRCWR